MLDHILEHYCPQVLSLTFASTHVNEPHKLLLGFFPLALKRLAEILRMEREQCLVYMVSRVVGANLDCDDRAGARSTGIQSQPWNCPAR